MLKDSKFQNYKIAKGFNSHEKAKTKFFELWLFQRHDHVLSTKIFSIEISYTY